MRNASIILILGISLFSFSCNQSGTPGKVGDMTTLNDSLSYFFGTDQVGKPLKEVGIDLSPEAFYAGYKAVLDGEELALDSMTLMTLSREFQQEYQKKAMEAQMKTSVEDGQVAPDLTMATPDGGEMSISDLRGQYVLIDFWASWCKPCRQENPNVVRMYNKYKDEGFEILGVSLDKDRDKWLQAIEQDGLIWEHMSDLKRWESESVQSFGFQGIPYTVLLDPEGKIVAQHLRGQPLEAKLQEIFGI